MPSGLNASSTVFALLSGGGNLPAALCTAAQAKGWPVHVVTFNGQPQPLALPQGLESQSEFSLAKVGAIIKHLKGQGVTHVAMAGNLNKPNILGLRPDLKGAALLARAVKNHSGHHDDALLRTVTEILGEEGFTVLSTEDLTPGLLASPEPAIFSQIQPTPADLADIEIAVNALKKIGELDIGQALIIHNHTILGIEGVEGTDALIARCAPLRSKSTGGILVKMAKPNQTRQADLPTVGPQTIANLVAHGYHGLTIQAGSTLHIDVENMVKKINKNKKLFMSFKM